MQKIDRKKWKRNEIYEFFSSVSHPFYMTTFNVDVTKVYQFAKENEISFYYTMIYLINESLNKVENFRYTVRDDEVFLLDRREPSVTVLNKETELFKIVYLPIENDIVSYCKRAKEISNQQSFFLDMGNETDGLFYYSCLPWIELTALTNEFDIHNPKLKDDTITRIGWGKFIEDNGKKKIGLSLEVNHRFIDGVHIGKFAQELEKAINAL